MWPGYNMDPSLGGQMGGIPMGMNYGFDPTQGYYPQAYWGPDGLWYDGGNWPGVDGSDMAYERDGMEMNARSLS